MNPERIFFIIPRHRRCSRSIIIIIINIVVTIIISIIRELWFDVIGNLIIVIVHVVIRMGVIGLVVLIFIIVAQQMAISVIEGYPKWVGMR